MISLELGGHPTYPRTSGPSPTRGPREVDRLENELHGRVCERLDVACRGPARGITREAHGGLMNGPRRPITPSATAASGPSWPPSARPSAATRRRRTASPGTRCPAGGRAVAHGLGRVAGDEQRAQPGRTCAEPRGELGAGISRHDDVGDERVDRARRRGRERERLVGPRRARTLVAGSARIVLEQRADAVLVLAQRGSSRCRRAARRSAARRRRGGRRRRRPGGRP